MEFKTTDNGFQVILTDEKEIDKRPGLYVEAPYYMPISIYHGHEFYGGPAAQVIRDMLCSRHCRIMPFRVPGLSVTMDGIGIMTLRDEERIKRDLVDELELLINGR